MVDIKNTDTAPSTIYLKDYQPPMYLIENVKLHFELHESQPVVTSVLNVKLNADNDQPTKKLYLDGQNLVLLSVKLNGNELSDADYNLDDAQLVLKNIPDSC